VEEIQACFQAGVIMWHVAVVVIWIQLAMLFNAGTGGELGGGLTLS
jgi:hypothetical protein